MRRLAFTLLPLLLTGCAMSPSAAPSSAAGTQIQGTLHGGRQPIIGAHVYLLAANTTGYGGNGLPATPANASISLLNATTTGLSDSLGAYVLTDTHGNFTISGDYTCTPNQQVYLYGIGGDPGSGTNSAASLMAILGACPASGSFTAIPSVTVNEVTTIAAAYAFAGFATDPTHVSNSGTSLARTGIANAFANASNLVDLPTGTALAITPAGNGAVPQTTINTLANILAACVNTTGTSSTGCSNLFSNATVDGTATGTQPTDTATAAINIAHNPGANIAALYGSPTPTSPFSPTLTGQPNDFTIALNFTGNGPVCVVAMAVDGSGSVWTANYCPVLTTTPISFTYSLSKFASSGAPLSPGAGFTGGGLNGPSALAIDTAGNAWVTNYSGNSVSEFSSAGVPFSPSTGFTGGGLNEPNALAIDGSGFGWAVNYVASLSRVSNSGVATNFQGNSGLYEASGNAVDGSGSIWTSNLYSGVVVKFSNAGNWVPPSSSGGGLRSSYSVAVDSFGNAWFANIDYNTLRGSVSKFSGGGTPLSPATGYVSPAMAGVGLLAIDGAGNVWMSSEGSRLSPSAPSAFIELSSSGVVLSPPTGYSLDAYARSGFAVDGSGNLWTSRYTSAPSLNYLTEVIGIAAPVITPIAAGLPAIPTIDGSSNLGTRP